MITGYVVTGTISSTNVFGVKGIKFTCLKCRHAKTFNTNKKAELIEYSKNHVCKKGKTK